MRVYAPATLADLTALASQGAWRPAAGAYAVTPALQGWVGADGPVDAEELELAALSEAARGSLRLLAAAGGGADVGSPARRVVVALDLPADQVAVADEGPEDPPGLVRLGAEPVPLDRVAAVHVDEPAAASAVAAAVAAVGAADAG